MSMSIVIPQSGDSGPALRQDGKRPGGGRNAHHLLKPSSSTPVPTKARGQEHNRRSLPIHARHFAILLRDLTKRTADPSTRKAKLVVVIAIIDQFEWSVGDGGGKF